MKRREFITLIGGSAATWPLTARAQQTKPHFILGILMNAAANDASSQKFVAVFEEALRKAGWAEGQNLQIERRWRSGNAEQALTYAKELNSASSECNSELFYNEFSGFAKIDKNDSDRFCASVRSRCPRLRF